jgi:predicted PurR-regulated permease PerM
VVLGSLVVIVAALYWTQKVLIPVALAILLSFVLAPFVNLLGRHRVNRAGAVVIVVSIALLVIAGIGAALALQMGRLIEELPQHKQNIASKVGNIREATRGTLLGKVQDVAREITQEWTRDEQTHEAAPAEPPMEVQIRSSGVSQFFSTLGPAAEILASAGLVFVLVIFMLLQKGDLRNRIVRLVGQGRLVSTTRALDEASRRISSFLLSQLLINAAFGCALTLGLLVLGIPYAFLWGVCGLVLRFIPYVGIWALTALLLAFSFLISPGWTQPIGALALVVCLELVTFNFIEPLVFRHSTGISTVALLIAAAFWTWLWGPIGLVLSTPITACLVVLGRYAPALAFFDILLGDRVEMEPPVMFYQRLLARDHDEAAELVEACRSTHPCEAVFDEVMIPALSLARRDQGRGELTEEDVDFVIRTSEDILEDLSNSQHGNEQDRDAHDHPVYVLGCPAHGAIDEVALHMFRTLLKPAGIHLEVVSSNTLLAERVAVVGHEQPAVVHVATIPPGSLAQTRYLYKRLHRQFPHLQILVGVWGTKEARTHLAERLGVSPAQVATTLVESRDQLVPLVRAKAPAPAAKAG